MPASMETFLNSDPGPVTQPWTWRLTFMQQSVLIAAVRGPDGIAKDHVSKLLCRWLRRCFLISAFDKRALTLPYDEGERLGGSFTGASISLGDVNKYGSWQHAMFKVVERYLRTVDELPHHFQLHLMHAAEILGYEHPDKDIRHWWLTCYCRMTNDLHLQPEPIDVMRKRLGDHQGDWLEAEEVTALGPDGG